MNNYIELLSKKNSIGARSPKHMGTDSTEWVSLKISTGSHETFLEDKIVAVAGFSRD